MGFNPLRLSRAYQHLAGFARRGVTGEPATLFRTCRAFFAGAGKPPFEIKNMLIGYAGVSTDEQNPDLQQDALEKAGCEKICTDQRHSPISADSLLALRQRLDRLPSKSPERSPIHRRAAYKPTALQIEWRLTQAFDAGYQSGENPMGAELEQNFDMRPTEIKALFANQLDPVRAGEPWDRMRSAGLPI